MIAFKAEASAWTPSAVQLQQVWVDPQLRDRGYAKRAMRDLCRRLLEQVPAVCLFVRPENDAGDPRLRGDRHAPDDRVPLADLLEAPGTASTSDTAFTVAYRAAVRALRNRPNVSK